MYDGNAKTGSASSIAAVYAGLNSNEEGDGFEAWVEDDGDDNVIVDDDRLVDDDEEVVTSTGMRETGWETGEFAYCSCTTCGW